MTGKTVTMAALYFVTSLFLAAAFSWTPFVYSVNLAAVSGGTACLLLLTAVPVSFIRPKVGTFIAVAAAGAALCSLIWMELVLQRQLAGSWITLNLPGEDYHSYIVGACLRIVAVAAVLFTLLLAMWRLTPAKYVFRNEPIRPALVLTLVALGTWFSHSARPYRIPIIVDAAEPQLVMLHVEKHGTQFHETSISIYHDSRVFISHNDRRLFLYEFKESVSEKILNADTRALVLHLIESPQLEGLKTRPPERLREWNAEAWFIATRHSHLFTFSKRNWEEMPAILPVVFHAIETLPPDRRQEYTAKDVCLGFCYDPLAGLGFKYVNQRCKTDQSGHTNCT